MAYQPAVLGTARLNNFRLDYLTPALEQDRPSHIRIILGGIEITHPDSPMRVIYKSLQIRDALFDAPNTCSFTIYGAAPTVGQPIEIWINSQTPQLLFNGELQTIERTYKGRPATVLHPVTAIDDTARANRRRPLGRFVSVSATTIGQWLITTYAPGFSSAGVEANLPPVSITFDGSEAGMKGCLTAVAKLIGGYWYFENKTLYLFVTPPGNPPDPIDDTPGRFLHDPAIAWAMDKSQVRTRVYGKGAGTSILASLDAGATSIPVENAEMFSATGGQAIAGVTPDGATFDILNYTGVQLGGTGALAGPGAAPSAAPGLSAAPGTGIESGTHLYAYTYVTAAGESLASPSAAITVGLTPPPSSAPVPGAPTAGGAIDPGTHYYATTFQTASGETSTAATSNAVTIAPISGSIPAPGATPAALRKVSGNLTNGVAYQYKSTFLGSGGETLPGAASASITPVAPTNPPIPWGHTTNSATGGNMTPGNYWWATAYVVGSSYETALDSSANAGSPLHGGVLAGYSAVEFQTYPSSDPRVTGIRVYRTKDGTLGGVPPLAYLVDTIPNTQHIYKATKDDASLGTARGFGGASPPIGTPPGDQAAVTVPTSTDPRTTGRKIYRSDAGAPFRYLATIHHNSPAQYIDNTTSVVTDPEAPTIDTTGPTNYQTVPLTGIPIGGAGVTARKLYRYSGAGPYKLLATIANNTATTYTDTAPTSSLGANMPATNTATANRVQIGVQIGGPGVTWRRLYRTAANSPTLVFLTTILDNTSTSYLDSFADAALSPGTVPPTIDTSGLQQPSGQVPAGSTSLIVANGLPFISTGGWAVIGNGEQVIRYTEATYTALTGIPATGPGSIVAAIAYNSTITAAPALRGVTGLAEAVIRNAPIAVWVQRDDLAAQAYMTGLDGHGDGVYEHIWSDERRSEASLRQVCDAQLALYSRPLVTVTYASRDLKTKSGKTVAINLVAPAIVEALTIQDVSITELGIRGLVPKFTVTASNVRQSFEAILQMLIRKADA